MRTVLNDAMYLHDLASLATLIAPLQTPATWMAAEWLDGIDIKVRVPENSSEPVLTPLTAGSEKANFKLLLFCQLMSRALPCLSGRSSCKGVIRRHGVFG